MAFKMFGPALIHRLLPVAAVGALLAACASTSVKTSWKSPDHPGGPVKKVAVLVVDDRGLVRQGMENRVGNQLHKQGQGVMTTFNLLPLSEIQQNKDAAAGRLRQAGADSVLIVRLVDRASYQGQVRASPALFYPGEPGYAGQTWYDYYSVAYLGMGVSWTSSRDYLTLDSSLFDLNSGARLWSCTTESVVKENSDRLEVADAFADKLVARLRESGLVR